jgi:hypothetical protein
MREALDFLLSDDFHINRRNFAALFEFIELHKVRTTVHTRHASLKRSAGAYEGAPQLASYVRRLRGLDARALFELEHAYRDTSLRLFALYRAEALSRALTLGPHWHDQPPGRNDWAIFERLYERNRELLLGNIAATQFWIDQFASLYARRGLHFSHAFVFGGSLIFTRVLMQLCSLYETRCMALESTFTGHQFYLEERYTPLAAGPDIQRPTVRAALFAEAACGDLATRRAQVHALMSAAKNKNVVQPNSTPNLRFSAAERPLLLIVGQVLNDFSIIEQRRCPLSTLASYRALLSACLERTDFNVVFKAHPWETRKAHLARAHTQEFVSELRRTMPEAYRQRVLVVSEENLIELGRRADRVVLLNSQAGIELAYHCGLRPSTLGHPYYARAGFSDDFTSCDALLEHVRDAGPRALLDLEGYEQLLEFLACFLGSYCISNTARGAEQLQHRLCVTSLTAPLQPAALELSLPRITAKSRKLLRDPRRFLQDSRLVRRLLKRG